MANDVSQYNVSQRGEGGAMFAAIIMMIAGAFGALQGIALIAKGTYYVQPTNYCADQQPGDCPDVPADPSGDVLR